ncbi:MAG: S41 family peptidase [Deltaproteobacteria bacterium]|nr:S41 family peptidase [Deltaproteobacteria bacterium]
MKRPTHRFLVPFLCGGVFSLAALFLTIGGVTMASVSRYEDLALFTSVLNHIRLNYVEPVDEHELLSSALNGLLRELDPHSAFMDSDAYREMQVDTRGEFHGLGIEITKRQDQAIEVVAPIDGTPAARAGIRSRDRITKICPTEPPEDWSEECRPTKSMTLLEAVKLMRGRKGTKIIIHIYREGFTEPEPFEIVRDVVQMSSVKGEMLEPGYAYVRVSAFQERTEKELGEELERLHAEAPEGFKGLVLDLRDNPGGLLDQAVRVSDFWLDEGLIVYTQGREETQRQEYLASAGATQGDYPLVVLVNEGSASASEIVAGALQDQHRALLLGVETFGKGSVQTVYPLDGGAGLRLTTALYYTPAGRSIQEKGILPDIEVAAAPPEMLADRARPRRVRERDLEGHFTHEEADPDAAPAEGEGEEGDEAKADDDADIDPQLERGLEVLKSWSYFERLRRGRDDEAVTVQAELVSDASREAEPGPQ